jgi:hypothetical protein
MVFNYLCLLALFQILRYLSFSRYIALTMYLDIIYIQIHSKTYISRIKKKYIYRKDKTSYNLKWRDYLLMHSRNGGTIY